MNQITFGNYKSYDDLFLICTGKTIGSPAAKTATVDIEGGDGVLDYTEYFGDVKYKNRKLKFDFESIVPQAQFPELYSAILNALNGQKMKIVLDEDAKIALNERLQIAMEQLADQPVITITYFVADSRKAGGAYVKHTGVIKKIDECERKVIFKDRTAIPIDNIYEMDGEIFKNLC